MFAAQTNATNSPFRLQQTLLDEPIVAVIIGVPDKVALRSRCHGLALGCFMGRAALKYLAESVLASEEAQAGGFASVSDEELRGALVTYREQVTREGFAVAKGLGVAVSAREGMGVLGATENAVKRSVLYFDDVLLPDPVFSLTEWTRDRQRMPAEDDAAPRARLVRAARYMQSLAPLVKIGRVRFVPSTRVLEPPEKLSVHFPEGPFYNSVPESVRDFLEKRARVVKVVATEKGERLVFPDPPDATTNSIQVDFGQVGSVMTYDHMRVFEVRDDGIVLGTPGPPQDAAALNGWIKQSINGSAAALVKEVLADVALAAMLRCTYVTTCSTTAQMLEILGRRGSQPDSTATAALSLQLPVLESASMEQLAELIERESASFDALRFELKVAAESLSGIEDPVARAEEGRKAEQRLAREQVHEVERKMREAKRALKWEIPLTLTQLAAGALGLLGGDITGLIVAGGIVGGGSTAAAAVKKFQEYRALPGYFLWKLSGSTSSRPR
ncbi:MAG: hypothetical protein H0U13_10015 [Gemmatimonadaceae bacterium]|nr:hypothetical protein [Gemmatimonadaceae bacterium]